MFLFSVVNKRYQFTLKMELRISPTLLLTLVTAVFCQDPNSVLDNLRINPDTISVSGFSSGACFASQFHMAFSASVRIKCLYVCKNSRAGNEGPQSFHHGERVLSVIAKTSRTFVSSSKK